MVDLLRMFTSNLKGSDVRATSFVYIICRLDTISAWQQIHSGTILSYVRR
jgi:hypothetical protein